MSPSPGPMVHRDDQMGDALAQMQLSGNGLAVVTDSNGQVIGTVVDGDIRRAALAGTDMTAPVVKVMGDEPVLVSPDQPDDVVRRLLHRHHLSAAAIVEGGRFVGLRHLSEVGGAPEPAIAVILAGGRGQRLRPVTDKVPKAFLTVGRTTIIERLLEQLWSAGITDVYLAVNYKAEVFEQRLGDGEGFGVNLHYLREHKPLHTAGPLSLLPERPTGAVLVMNADQVTALNFTRMVDFHRQQAAAMTIGAFVHEVSIPYGVLRLEGERVRGIDEKPTLRRLCNAGIYVLEPDVLDLVPRNTFFGMPSLAEAVVADGRPMAAFPILEKFIDIGTPEELEAALLYFATGEEV